MEHYDQIWEAIFKLLQNRLTDTVANLWFGDVKLLSLDDHNAHVESTSAIKRRIIMNSHIESLHDAFADVLGYRVDVLVTYPGITQAELDEKIVSYTQVRRDIQKQRAEEAKKREEEAAKQPGYVPIDVSNEAEVVKKSSLNADYTFESFIVGNSNKFAYSASYAVAKAPATDYNPLFIYGQSGLGKTHLLNAIMNEVTRLHPEMTIMYVKGDDFTNQMIESIRRKNQDEFRMKYRKADVLLIDDIQFIAGKESTQEEFFHTFNALYEDGKQIIMTSDRPPKDIQRLEDRLKSRFEWGLIVDVQPPDFELRIAIIKNKQKTIGLELTDEMLEYVAENLRSNIRQLEGAVKRIGAKTFLSGESLTMNLVKECISSLITGDESPTITADKIISMVAKKYDISRDDVLGKKRDQNIAYARNLSIYIIRRVTQMSFPEIGKIFGRDHSTIMSSNKVIQEKVATNQLAELEINEIIRELSE